MGKRAIRLVENWGDLVYCACCKKYRSKEYFIIRKRNDKYYYDSYCKKCRSTLRLKPRGDEICFAEEIPALIKAKWEYAHRKGLLIYPCYYTYKNINPKVEQEKKEQLINECDIYKEDLYKVKEGLYENNEQD